jgi:hypothetical protein
MISRFRALIKEFSAVSTRSTPWASGCNFAYSQSLISHQDGNCLRYPGRAAIPARQIRRFALTDEAKMVMVPAMITACHSDIIICIIIAR